MTYNNRCVYRFINNCNKCNNLTYRNMDFCNIHINYSNNLYKIIKEPLTSIDNIFKLFKYIYQDDTIYTKKFTFKTCLYIIFTRKIYLLNIYKDLEKHKNLSITRMIDYIYDFNYNIYNILLNKKKELNIIYKFLLNSYINKINNIGNSINMEDPFTLDIIDNIYKNQIFKYKDIDNVIYSFKALELKYYLLNIDNKNPFNNQLITKDIIYKLDLFIKIVKLDINIIINNYKINNIIQAFTEVSKCIEKMGFYNNVEWFLKLSTEDIRAIILTYQFITSNIISHDEYIYFMDIDYVNNLKIDFCREIIKLFNDYNNNFLLCCYFIKVVGLYSTDLYNNIPSWIIDITTPHYIIDNNIMLILNII